MVCPYCQQSPTQVINSRPNKQTASVWRRRRCLHCQAILTTYETISSTMLPPVHAADGVAPYDEARLMISIYRELPHNRQQAAHAAALASTVTHKLLTSGPTREVVSIEDIIKTTQLTLERFHAASGLRYGLSHGMESILSGKTRRT